MSLANITTILFDLDGTLRHNRPASNDVFLDYAVRLGANDSLEKRRAAARWTHYYWATSDELQEDQEAYRGDEERFWTNYARRNLAAFGCDQGCIERLASQVHQYMRDHHQPQDWVPPEVPRALQALKQAGFRLAVISNRREPCHDYLHQLALLEYFELVLVAGEVDIWKPDPQIFIHAVQRLGVAAQETVYVGDNFYADVVGAQKAGLLPVLVDPEQVFPDAGCATISHLGELPALFGVNT